jgi:hypothetical protein
MADWWNEVKICPCCQQIIGSGFTETELPDLIRDSERRKTFYRYLRRTKKKHKVEYSLIAQTVLILQDKGMRRQEAIEETARTFKLGPRKFSVRTVQRALNHCGM